MLRESLAALEAGRVPPAHLLVSHRVSRTREAFRVLSPAARALTQLEAAGKPLRPGQRVRFIYTRGEPGVHAWDLPEPLDSGRIDVERYRDLLLRAAAAVLQPLIGEAALRRWVSGEGEQMRLPFSRSVHGRSGAAQVN